MLSAEIKDLLFDNMNFYEELTPVFTLLLIERKNSSKLKETIAGLLNFFFFPPTKCDRSLEFTITQDR